MRELATFRTISELNPIEGADMIEVAVVDGWEVVVKKGDFKVGDNALYLEIDSWVPHELAPFLTKNAAIPKEYNGVPGARLRTIRLRGQISQGLLLPITEYGPGGHVTVGGISFRAFEHENDLSEFLNIQKWEKPLPAQLAGTAKGNFPTDLVPKTDEERIQNCFKHVQKALDRNDTFEVSLKLDGSSCTILRYDGVLRVASRNLELKIDEENKDNSYVKMAMDLDTKIRDGFAVQGELMGPGIQGNRENLPAVEFFVFNIYDIDGKTYLTPYERQAFCHEEGLTHVPVFEEYSTGPKSVKEALEMADKVKSINHEIAEGIVFKSNTANFSFKAISNNFLLKGGD